MFADGGFRFVIVGGGDGLHNIYIIIEGFSYRMGLSLLHIN